MIPRQKEHIEPKKHFLRKNIQKMPLAYSLENGSTTSFSEGYNAFSFTGKEKDSESGYYYFGARYYQPTLSIWNSVDPMADKYPSLSPYNYCAWNPMKLVDPNGDTIVYTGTKEQQVILQHLVSQFKERLPDKYELLANSKNVYNVQYSDGNDDGSGGSFTYDINSGCFNVNIASDRNTANENSYSDIEVLAHEFKHAEQYEGGQLGFKVIHSTGKVIPYAYDQQDEIEAAIQANLFNSKSSNTYDAIKSIINITRSKYNYLPHNSINVYRQNQEDLKKFNDPIIRGLTIDGRNMQSNSIKILYNKRR